jgi:poly-gamma-glutamate synthesis protein (capsule biosynthesis protein)
MEHKILVLILLILTELQIFTQETETGDKRISLLFIGDIMGHDEQIWSAENRETHTYYYDDVFKYIKEEISEADIAIANFEVTLAGPPYKGYPAFSSPAELALACSNAGIDYFVTANNHSADRGKKGIVSTINKLDSLKIPHTGTFTDRLARDTLYPLFINKKGLRLALLNYTYGTNGINVPPPVIVNMLDKETIAADIEKAKLKRPDAIILFLHWGTEYDTIPSENQAGLADYFFSCGADLIIGSHPHVMQKMILAKTSDNLRDRIVVYSMGNFVSNQRKPKTDGGAMVRIEFEQKDGLLKVSNAGYYLTWVYTPIENYRKHFFVLPCSKFENYPGVFSNPADFEKMTRFIFSSRRFLNSQNINFNEFIYTGNEWIR